VLKLIQSAAESTPGWLNWVVVVGSAALSWLQPIAAVVAILWGGLQIYLAVEKRWFPKRRP
jgi:hypothetical protein